MRRGCAGIPRFWYRRRSSGNLRLPTTSNTGGLAKALIRDAVDRTLQLSLTIGIRALVVDPLNSNLTMFYDSLGFEGFNGETRMYFRMPNYPRTL